MNRIHNYFLCLVMLSAVSQGMSQEYRYQRPLDGIHDSWHRILVPEDMFRRVASDFSDLRILGIRPSGDTIEAPYLLSVKEGSHSSRSVAFSQLNTGVSQAGFTTTLRIPGSDPINRISLQFEQQNFDWQVTLEGRHRGGDWITVGDDYRILAFHSPEASYAYTDLTFADADFHEYRITIPGATDPGFMRATTTFFQHSPGQMREFTITNLEQTEDKSRRVSIVDVTLSQAVPVRELHLHTESPIDFFRPIMISALVDSVNTEKGWKYQYRRIGSGMFTSFGENHYEIDHGVIRKLRIEIENQDNEPIVIEGISASGYEHELVARFSEEASYFLTYGRDPGRAPQYDIARFPEKIPSELSVISAGTETAILQESPDQSGPLFESEIWLWAIMGIIMVLLVWYTIKMINGKEAESE